MLSKDPLFSAIIPSTFPFQIYVSRLSKSTTTLKSFYLYQLYACTDNSRPKRCYLTYLILPTATPCSSNYRRHAFTSLLINLSNVIPQNHHESLIPLNSRYVISFLLLGLHNTGKYARLQGAPVPAYPKWRKPRI